MEKLKFDTNDSHDLRIDKINWAATMRNNDVVYAVLIPTFKNKTEFFFLLLLFSDRENMLLAILVCIPRKIFGQDVGQDDSK